MKITIFTSNQARHLHLINSMSEIADEVYAIQECTTVFPGKVDDFFHKSDVFQEYFSKVMESQKKVFGDITFLNKNVHSLSVKLGDLNNISLETLKPALQSDYYIIFGSSFIKGDLIDFLVKNQAINIHMGVSPYYRGSSCNFWASYQDNPHLVGATIHMLSKGLDSGDMLYHALPKPDKYDPFDLGMYAVKAAHESLVTRIADGSIFKYKPVKQNKNSEISYTKNKDFDDIVAKNYLNNLPTSEFIYKKLQNADTTLFLNPYFGK